MRELQRIDLSVYAHALRVYALNPIVVLAPVAAELANVLLGMLLGGSGLAGLVGYLVSGFGLGVAIIVADQGWRYKRASFETAWNEAQRKAPELLMATLGFGFVMFAAGLVGGMAGPFGVILQALAFGFLIYTLPAAAIGGVPGGAALQISVDRARTNPAATIVLAVVCVAIYLGITIAFEGYVMAFVVEQTQSPIWPTIVLAFLRAIGFGYIAIVIAKVYNDVSYGRRY